MSPIHIYQDLPDGCDDASIMEYVYDIGFGDPEDFLKELLGADEKGYTENKDNIFILLNLEELICRTCHSSKTYLAEIFYVAFIHQSTSRAFDFKKNRTNETGAKPRWKGALSTSDIQIKLYWSSCFGTNARMGIYH